MKYLLLISLSINPLLAIACSDNTPEKKKNPFENIVRKGETAGNQNFLPFSPCFLPMKDNFHINLSSADPYNLEKINPFPHDKL